MGTLADALIRRGMTANDAQLRDRATHTGTQPMDSVSGLLNALSINSQIAGAKIYSGWTGDLASATPTSGLWAVILNGAGTHTDAVLGAGTPDVGFYRANGTNWLWQFSTDGAKAKAWADAAAASAASLNALLTVNSFDPATHWAVKDAAGNLLMDVAQDTITHPHMQDHDAKLATLNGAEKALLYSASNPFAPAEIAMVDSADNLVARIATDKITHPDVDVIRVQAAQAYSVGRSALARGGWSSASVPCELRARIAHLMVYGQSLAMNCGINIDGEQVSPDVLEFVGGVWNGDQTRVTATVLASAVKAKRTAASATIRMIRQLLLAEDGIDLFASGQRWLLSNPAIGGSAIGPLSTTFFGRVSEDYNAGRTIADSIGQGIDAPAILWVQGESDYVVGTTRAAYLTALRSMQAAVESAGRTAHGTTRDTPLLTYQTATHIGAGSATPSIALAQLDADADDKIAMVCPMYQMTYGDNLHLAEAYKQYEHVMAYFGLALKRWIFDRVKPKALAPIGAWRAGKTITLRYPLGHGRKLVWDTTTIPAQVNNGFAVVDSGGGALTVSSVAIVGADRIEIRLAANVPAGAKVRYAWSNIDTTATGPGACGRGNLRDDNPLIFDPYDIPRAMPKWAAISETEVL